MNPDDAVRPLTRADVIRLLTPCGEEGAPAMRERVLEETPEAVANVIRPLLEAGLIDGWRHVCCVRPPGPLPGAVSGPHSTGHECCITKKG